MAIIAKSGSGLWTPTAAFATPGDSSIAYTTQTGTWTRVQDRVMLDFFLNFTPTIGTASGNLVIGGLPFAMADTSVIVGSVLFVTGNFAFPAGRSQAFLNAQSSTLLRISTHGTDASQSQITATEVNTGESHQMRGALVYRTDAD